MFKALSAAGGGWQAAAPFVIFRPLYLGNGVFSLFMSVVSHTEIGSSRCTDVVGKQADGSRGERGKQVETSIDC